MVVLRARGEADERAIAAGASEGNARLPVQFMSRVARLAVMVSVHATRSATLCFFKRSRHSNDQSEDSF